MKKNVSGQIIGAQMVSAADGSAFSGSVTVYVTGDGGTQAIGTVGSGVCTNEGNGFYTYAPSQAETNYDHVAFTFIGTGAIPASVQVYTNFPQTGDGFSRLGAPAGASVSADVAAVKTDTAAIKSKTDNLPSDPADESSIQAAIAGVDSKIDTVDTVVDAIKAKTDNLPSDPADESSIQAAIAGVDSKIDTVDSNVDAIKAKTDNLPASPAAVSDIPTVSAIADGVWDEPTSGHQTAGTTGKALTDAGAAGTPPTPAEIADAVWDEILSGHLGAGSTGEALNAAGAAGDPWTTQLPGAYGAGSAGKIIGDNIDAAVSSRLASANISLSGGKVTVGTNDDKTGYGLADGAITAAKIADAAFTAAKFASGAFDAVWSVTTRTLSGFGTLVADIWANATRTLTAGPKDSEIDAIKAKTDQLDFTGAAGALKSESTNMRGTDNALLASGYTAPDNAGITAIKAKTDDLPADPAGVSDIPTANQNADALLDRANAIETGLTLREAQRLQAAAAAGKLSGAGTSTVSIRNVGDTKDRIVATVDEDGNREAVNTDVS